MSKLLITHTDLDGAGVIVLCKLFEIKIDKLLVLNYDDITSKENFLKENDFLEYYIADFSFEKDFITYLLENGKKVFIYDHHPITEELLNLNHDNLKIFFDKEKCGTEIFFEKFIKLYYRGFKKCLLDFVRLVGVYDLWKEDDEDWLKAVSLNFIFCYYRDWKNLENYNFQKFNLSMTYRLKHYNFFFFTEQEKKYLATQFRKLNSLYEDAVSEMKLRIDERGLKFGIIRAGSKISLIASRILNTYKDLNYLIIINTYMDDSYTNLHFRSKGKVKANELEIFKGHDCAGGGIYPDGKLLWEGRINSIPYKKN